MRRIVRAAYLGENLGDTSGRDADSVARHSEEGKR
jgi:hypothetical protein